MGVETASRLFRFIEADVQFLSEKTLFNRAKAQ